MAGAEDAFYDRALLYEIAFGYRDFRAEVDALLGWAERVSGRVPRSAIELAAGPAEHAVELAARGLAATALDLAPSMLARAREKARARGVPLAVVEGDMIDFALAAPVDLACLVLSSIGHVHDLDALVRHLRSVARALAPGGVYVIEAPHPRDFLSPGGRVTATWTERRDGLEVETSLGGPDDAYDPLAQVCDVGIVMKVRHHEREETYNSTVRLRDWTPTELEAAVRLAGGLAIAERHGEWGLDAPFDATPSSWRAILVLRRT